MSNKLDDSLFEDVPYEAQSNDDLFEDVPYQDNYVEAKESPTEALTKAMGKPVLGAALGSAADNIIRHGTDFVMTRQSLGGLDKATVNNIADNADVYKNAPKVNTTLDRFGKLADDLRTAGIKAANDAKASLKGKPAVPAEEFYKSLGKASLADAEEGAFGLSIPEGRAEELQASRLDEIAPLRETEAQRLAKIEQELAGVEAGKQNLNQVDGRDLLTQSHRDAAYNRKMEQLSTLPENQKLPIIDEFQGRKDAQRISQLEELLAQARGQTTQPAVERLDDFNFNRDNNLDKTEKLRELTVERGGELDAEKNKIIDDHANRRDNLKVDRLEQDIAKTESKIAKDIQKVEQKKQAFQQSMADRNEKTAALREVDQNNAQSRLQARKDQLTFNKIQQDEKAVARQVEKQQKKLQRLETLKTKLEEQKAKSLGKVEAATKEATAKAASDLDVVRGTPKEILNTTPDLGKFAAHEDRANLLNKATETVRRSGAKELAPLEMHNLLDQMRKNVPQELSDTTGKFAAKLSETFNEDLGGMFEDYKNLKTKSHEIRKPQEWLELLGMSHRDIGGDKELIFDDGSRGALNHVLANPQDNPARSEYLRKAVEDSARLGVLPEGTDVDALLKEAEMSALKSDVERLRGKRNLTSFEMDAVAKGDMGRAGGVIAKAGGTRAQELYALMKGSGAGKALAKASKFGLPLVGAGLASVASANAMDEGKIGPIEAGTLTATELVNPLPLDTTEGYLKGKEAYTDNINEQKLTEDYFNGGDVSQTEALKAGVKAGGTELVRPINEIGTDLSNNARSRMDQNMKAADMFKKKEEPKSHEEFKSFVEMKPEQIQDLAQYFSADEKLSTFSAPLEKALNSDERTKSAVLFGLYQQPAFRAAIKAMKK